MCNEVKNKTYNEFKKKLGERDAIVQFTELMTRDFMKIYGNEVKNSNFLRNKSNEYELNLTCFDYKLLINKLVGSYIINVNVCFEEYLRKVYGKIRKYFKNYIPKKQEESLLECVLNNLDESKMDEKLHYYYRVCEYYRLLRNFFVHGKKDIKDNRELLLKEINKAAKKYKIDSWEIPNKLEEVNYNDFKLFSISSLKVGKFIITSLVYDVEKIYENNNWNNLKKYKNNLPKMKKCIESFLKNNYNISDIKYVDYIFNKINE
ncbi:hypothetical protein [Clostridium sp.]|uniref:hypothetical protein n=1 Tax=Clostridium sp. TaxID=1506 RepID=UPI00290C9682|nr:hypothetical protein [Clostridium sp.]MDU4848512.1 hypothetical protein [Clostridium sp.]